MSDWINWFDFTEKKSYDMTLTYVCTYICPYYQFEVTHDFKVIDFRLSKEE